MKRFIAISCLISASLLAYCQTQINPVTQIRWPAVTGTTPPNPNTCTSLSRGLPYLDITTNVSYICGNTGYVPPNPLSLAIGTVSTGSVPAVTIGGASPDYTLNFIFPTGTFSPASTYSWTAEQDFGSGFAHLTNPMLINAATSNFQAALTGNAVAGKPTRILWIDSDSISCCGKVTNFLNNPPYWMAPRLFAAGGTHGYGIYPVIGGGNLGALPGWFGGGGTGTTPIPSDFGPTQTTPGNQFGSIWQITGAQTLSLAGSTGNGLLGLFTGDHLQVLAECSSITTPVTVTLDTSFVLDTNMVAPGSTGGACTTPQMFFKSYAIPNSDTAISHSVTFSITGGSGALQLYGAGYTSGQAGVEIDNWSHGTADTTACGAANWASCLAILDTYSAATAPPDAAIIGIGVNNILHSVGTATSYTADVQAVLTHLRALNPYMTIIIWDENDIAPTGTGPTKAQIVAAEKTLAQANGAQYVSTFESFGPEAGVAARNWMYVDGIHPVDPFAQGIGNQLYDALMGGPAATLTGGGANGVSVPSFYNQSTATASGTTVTFTAVTGPIYMNTAGTFSVTGCADTNYNGTSLVPLSINGAVLTYTAPSTPGASTTGCIIVPGQWVVNLNTLSGNTLFIDVALNTIAQAGVIQGGGPYQTVIVSELCGSPGPCAQGTWPSQFLYPPVTTPLVFGQRITAAYTTDSASAPVNPRNSPTQAISGAIPTSALAAGSCTATITATIPGSPANGGQFWITGAPFDIGIAAGTLNVGLIPDIPTKTGSATATFHVCNISAGSITPNSGVTFTVTQ